MNVHAEYIFRALGNCRGDELERAEMAFGNMTEAQLDDQYGQSGKTCREILDGYREQRRKHDAAYEWLESRIGLD